MVTAKSVATVAAAAVVVLLVVVTSHSFDSRIELDQSVPVQYESQGNPQLAQDEGYASDEEPVSSWREEEKPVVFSHESTSVLQDGPPFQAQVPAMHSADTLPNFFVAPFQRWWDEDNAQKASDIAQWRVGLLQSKLKQAKLQRELQKVYEEGGSKNTKLKEDERQLASLRMREKEKKAGKESRGEKREQRVETLRKQTANELASIEHQMLTLAHSTATVLKEGAKAEQAKVTLQSRQAQRQRAMRRDIASLGGQVKALESKVKANEARDPPSLADAEVGASLAHSVPAQVEMWDRVSKDLEADGAR